MINQRYPDDLTISVQDFIDSGWRGIIDNISIKDCSTMWRAFSKVAESAIESGQNERGKVLWLLADACSMMLRPSSQNEPFKPCMVTYDSRSVAPDDFSDSDMAFFEQIVDEVDDNWLKVRLSDLVWLKKKPRNVSFVLKAIDAYCAIPLDLKTWIHDGQACWARAISLSRMIKRGAGDRLKQIEEIVIDAFNKTTRLDHRLARELAHLLKSNRLGQTHQIDIAKKLEMLAREFDSENNLNEAREYFLAAAIWFEGDKVKKAEMKVFAAETWVTEAQSDGLSSMNAASFYENAIKTYREIPSAERAKHQVDKRITDLKNYLDNAGRKTASEMHVIQTPDIDITQIVEQVRKSVSGKSVQDALLLFANLRPVVNVEELRNSVLERMQNSLSSLFSVTTLSSDGRVIAKRPHMNMGAESTGDNEVAILAEMIRDYLIWVNDMVQSLILPALEVLLLEHRLGEIDFIDLARWSPIVPAERAGLFGKALFAGYDRDFVTAVHVLIPQIEHMVRVHLKQAGANTTNLDIQGIQNENGMSTLMDLPQTEQVFGKDLTFELKALFCNAHGPNLRNELAHELLDEDKCRSGYVIYAWWLAFKIVFNPWWNAAQKKAINDSAENE